MRRKPSVLRTAKVKDGTTPAIPLPTTTTTLGTQISLGQIRKIRADLLSGAHPNLSTIARRNGVRRAYVKKLLDQDPELKQCYEDALAETAEHIEQAAVDMCLDDSLNPIAREKMIEFCLPKMMPERYGENANLGDAAKNLPRISVSLTLPVIEKKEEVIQVQTSNPPYENPDCS